MKNVLECDPGEKLFPESTSDKLRLGKQLQTAAIIEAQAKSALKSQIEVSQTMSGLAKERQQLREQLERNRKGAES